MKASGVRNPAYKRAYIEVVPFVVGRFIARSSFQTRLFLTHPRTRNKLRYYKPAPLLNRATFFFPNRASLHPPRTRNKLRYYEPAPLLNNDPSYKVAPFVVGKLSIHNTPHTNPPTPLVRGARLRQYTTPKTQEHAINCVTTSQTLC